MRLIFQSYNPQSHIFQYCIEDEEIDPNDPLQGRAITLNEDLKKLNSDPEIAIATSRIYTVKNIYHLENYLLENKLKFLERGVTQSNWRSFIDDLENKTGIHFFFKEKLCNSPDDTLGIIRKYLDSTSRIQFSKINKHHYKFLQGLTLKIHFPKAYKEIHLNAASGSDYQQRFLQEEKNQYAALDDRNKKLMRLFKEGDLTQIKIMNLTSEELWLRDFIQVAFKNKHQSIIDYCHNEIILPFYKVNEDKIDSKKSDNRKLTLLHWSVVTYRSLDYLDSLIKDGANIYAETSEGWYVLHISAYLNNLVHLKYFFAKLTSEDKATFDINKLTKKGATPLSFAAHENSLDCLKYLVAHHADINKADNGGFTPLYSAAQTNSFVCLKYLVDHNADINKAENDGFTPLHIAAFKNSFESLKYLVDHNADIDKASNDGRTPLYSAAQNNYFECLKYLVDHNADVNKPCLYNSTPLHIAARNNCLESLEYLVEKGADLFAIYQKSGKIALQIAVEEKNDTIAMYLAAQPKMVAKYFEDKKQIPEGLKNQIKTYMQERLKSQLQPIFSELTTYLNNLWTSRFSLYKPNPSFKKILSAFSLIQQYNKDPHKIAERAEQLSKIPNMPSELKNIFMKIKSNTAQQTYAQEFKL